ncbi:MAG: family 2 glycosyl transferase [Synechococcales cyanobacterium K44_A2020_017]|uniref:hypothetical protein n=1 Tax=Leptolyngbya sp. CCY15150 TaxID=2767772 RepID=UPI001951F375|nr:hypothetical protein [Leptolyngbya sp. CCY15150]MBF2087319.1 family 2 glycosyl transferase [Synechococcales cyanobacterium K32_A2020_035]MBF2096408.1 family 2 glycosyl transferase [Synechococcales cyanobacterium K44_A2020_017]
MVWQIRVQYANGNERVIWSFRNRESALKGIDVLYSQGYPMHMAYVVRSVDAPIAA